MIEMLQYGFMQRAFITGILLAVIAPLIGITIVLKRMSMIGDALSHASLAGVALGLLLGINPILGAMGICLFAALGVEAIRRKIPRYSEMAISIIMSTGIGLAGILSGFVKNGTNFNSFLFGSIISISKDELKIVCVISVLVLLCVLLLYKELFYIGFEENAARISGVPVKNGWNTDRLIHACDPDRMRNAGRTKLQSSHDHRCDHSIGHNSDRINTVLLCRS